MEGERGMLWVTGKATIVTDDRDLRRAAPTLFNDGFAARFTSFDEAVDEPVEGLLVVDARKGIQHAIKLLRRLDPNLCRDAVILANPLEPFVFRTIRSICHGAVLYDPVDVNELSDVMENVLSRRKAS